MTKDLFEIDNYKKFLKKTVSEGGRGMVNQLALAAGCQRSYLSQALNSHVNLTSDHLYGIAEFLRLGEVETDYLLTLLERDKVSSFKLRERLEAKRLELSKRGQRLSERLSRPDEKIAERYYSAWYYSALHIATSIEELRNEKDFAKYLNLDVATVGGVLRELQSWGLVHQDRGSWSYAGAPGTHLKDDSTMNRMNHMNWRTRALAKPLQSERDLHYSSVFTISKSDFKLLRGQLLAFIEKQREHIGESDSEELVCFCADYFRVR